MMRTFLVTIALLSGYAVTALGQSKIGGQLGIDLSGSNLFIGANAVFDLPWEVNFHTMRGNPELSYYPLDDSPGHSRSLTMIALNTLYPLDVDFANAYIGGGLLIGLYRGELTRVIGGNQEVVNLDDTNFGLDAKFGVDFGKEDSKITPWVESGINIIDGGGFFVQGGARFAL